MALMRANTIARVRIEVTISCACSIGSSTEIKSTLKVTAPQIQGRDGKLGSERRAFPLCPGLVPPAGRFPEAARLLLAFTMGFILLLYKVCAASGEYHDLKHNWMMVGLLFLHFNYANLCNTIFKERCAPLATALATALAAAFTIDRPSLSTIRALSFLTNPPTSTSDLHSGLPLADLARPPLPTTFKLFACEDYDYGDDGYVSLLQEDLTKTMPESGTPGRVCSRSPTCGHSCSRSRTSTRADAGAPSATPATLLPCRPI